MTDSDHYLCEFRLAGQALYIIWYTDDQDGVIRRSDGRVATFTTPDAARAHAASIGVDLPEGIAARYDWDELERWCAAAGAEDLDPVFLLDAWNMLVDMQPPDAAGRLFQRVDRARDALYDKLFRANNLPAVTPAGGEYHPIWTAEERATLSHVLALGLAELRHQLTSARAI